MEVGQLTIEQKDLIQGQLFAIDSYFNAIQDINDVWIISTQEMEQAIYFVWVKDLPLITYEPKPTPNPF